jgi:hypothetical protein
VGQRGPVCGPGRFDEVQPGVEMRMEGQALLSAMRYALAKLRCSACGEGCTAPLPKEAAEEKSRARARAVWAVGRDDVGRPLDRREDDHAMLGVPVPEAPQWDQIACVGDRSSVGLASLERLAAQGELMDQDDTPVRILSRIDEHHERPAHAEARGLSRSQERTGRSTTAVAVKGGARTLCLSDSGRAHAGAHRASWVKKRQAGHEKPLVRSEALTRNAADEARLLRCHG